MDLELYAGRQGVDDGLDERAQRHDEAQDAAQLGHPHQPRDPQDSHRAQPCQTEEQVLLVQRGPRPETRQGTAKSLRRSLKSIELPWKMMKTTMKS